MPTPQMNETNQEASIHSSVQQSFTRWSTSKPMQRNIKQNEIGK